MEDETPDHELQSANVGGSADERHPDSDEAHAADRFLAEQDPEDAERVAEHHEEMRKIGANVKGEGEIE